jgi:flagellar M-ring protein FliF
MGEFISRLQKRVLTYYNGLEKNRRRLLIGGIILGVLLLTFGILYFTRTEYVEIARGLTASEAQVITSRLDELDISWQDSENTSVILVPKQDASRARMEIAADVAAGNFSWSDIFNNESITMTSQTREQMYIQALAADIEQSIETISAVDDASVILQIPKESNYFLADEIKSRASVVLTLKNGHTLDEQKINGIVNLIVSAVSDLVPENVTILDSDGNQLNDPDATDSFTASTQYDLQVKIQNQLKNDLEDFLEKIYGVGNVDVRPAMTLDFNQQTETQTLFSPPIDGATEGIPRSISRITENVVNGTGAVGTPGTDTNSSTITSAVESSTDNSTYEKASETLNYELNEIYREIVKSQGDVVSMSIGVLINSDALVDGIITDQHYSELLNLIAMAAGTSTDNITIYTQAFPDPMANYDIYTGQDTAGMLFGVPIWALVLIVVVTLIIVLVVILVLRRNRSKREAEEAARNAEIEEQKQLEEIGADLEDKGSPKYHIEKFVDTNPEAAAALLRAWLNDN